MNNSLCNSPFPVRHSLTGQNFTSSIRRGRHEGRPACIVPWRGESLASNVALYYYNFPQYEYQSPGGAKVLQVEQIQFVIMRAINEYQSPYGAKALQENEKILR